MIPENYTATKIYEFDDANPEALVVDLRFKNTTIIVQPLNLIDPPVVLLPELLTEDASVGSSEAGLAGTVTINVQPPKTINTYELEDTIDLTTPSILSTEIPIHKIHPTLTGLAGCTHVAVSVIGYV